MEQISPVISVLMGVFNCEKTLDESLECLFAQTEPRWECIICDDGSTDHTADIVRSWQKKFPEKIVFIQNKNNNGLSYALNRCLEQAKGRYAARMDGDDRCSSDRFEKELRYLQENPDKAIVSVDMQCFDAEGIWGLRAYPTLPQPSDFIHGTPFCHAGCMVLREELVSAGGYSEEERFSRVEDYELWLRMYTHGYRGGNIHEPLYQMRDDRNAASRRKWKYRVNEARVRLLAVREFSLPKWMCIYALRPLLLGLMPAPVSSFLHRQKLKRGNE